MPNLIAALLISTLVGVTPALSQHDCRSGCWAVPPPAIVGAITPIRTGLAFHLHVPGSGPSAGLASALCGVQGTPGDAGSGTTRVGAVQATDRSVAMLL